MFISTLLSVVLSAATFAPGTPSAPLLADVHIARVQARATALQACAGAVIQEGLERLGARWIYAFEIRPILPGRGNHIVQVDAGDGTLVAVIRPGARR